MEEDQIIPKLVDDTRAGKMPRRQLVKSLTAMGLSTAGVGAIVAFASSSPLPVPTVNASEDAAKHLQLHDEHLEKQGNADTDALHHDYAHHAIVEDPMHPEPIIGREAIIARKTLGFAAVTDAQIQVLQRIVSGNQVTVEWLATGIHSGDLPGLPASNRPYALHGVTVVVRENGLIVREALYYDVNDLVNQLRSS